MRRLLYKGPSTKMQIANILVTVVSDFCSKKLIFASIITPKQIGNSLVVAMSAIFQTCVKKPFLMAIMIPRYFNAGFDKTMV